VGCCQHSAVNNQAALFSVPWWDCTIGKGQTEIFSSERKSMHFSWRSATTLDCYSRNIYAAGCKPNTAKSAFILIYCKLSVYGFGTAYSLTLINLTLHLTFSLADAGLQNGCLPGYSRDRFHSSSLVSHVRFCQGDRFATAVSPPRNFPMADSIPAPQRY